MIITYRIYEYPLRTVAMQYNLSEIERAIRLRYLREVTL
jgi:hypothetical protein